MFWLLSVCWLVWLWVTLHKNNWTDLKLGRRMWRHRSGKNLKDWEFYNVYTDNLWSLIRRARNIKGTDLRVCEEIIQCGFIWEDCWALVEACALLSAILIWSVSSSIWHLQEVCGTWKKTEVSRVCEDTCEGVGVWVVKRVLLQCCSMSLCRWMTCGSGCGRSCQLGRRCSPLGLMWTGTLRCPGAPGSSWSLEQTWWMGFKFLIKS